MRIRMKATSAGPDGVLNEGKVYDVADKKGRELVDGGYAVELAASPPAETATVEAPETAVAVPQGSKSLSGMNKAELQAEAEQRGLSTDGTNAELVDRINEHDGN